MQPEHQAKLLRFVETRVATPLGGRPRKVDVLLVAATNKDLERVVAENAFRRDLVNRFRDVVHVPPLRARPEDLWAIAKHCAPTLDDTQVEVEAVERLLVDDWPDNVRGLERLFRAGPIARSLPALKHADLIEILGPFLARALTNESVDAALAAEEGNESAAARRLGVSRGALLRFLQRRDRDRPPVDRDRAEPSKSARK